MRPVDDPIVASGDLVLFALPSQLGGDGGNVTLVLLNGNGTPVPGVQLTGTCTAGAGLTSVDPGDQCFRQGDRRHQREPEHPQCTGHLKLHVLRTGR